MSERSKHFTKARFYYERNMEMLLRLDNGTWVDTMMSSVSNRAEEMVWIVDENPKSMKQLKALLDVYLKLQLTGLANVLFKIVTLLNPSEHGLHRKYADFLNQHGLILDAMNVLLADLQEVITEKYPDEKYPDHVDSYQGAMVHGLQSLTVGWDSIVVGLARRLLLPNNTVVMETLNNNCHMTMKDWPKPSASITSKFLRELVLNCMEAQDVIGSLIERGAAHEITNGFGYTPLHYAAMFGEQQLLGKIVDTRPNMSVVTSVNHNALHLAVMRGHINLVGALILSGAQQNEEDRRGNTASDVACLHRYSAPDLARLFGQDESQMCTAEQLEVKTATLDGIPKTEWRHERRSKSAVQSGCDFDVRAGLTRQEFIFDYLAIQRPVLIRGGLKGKHWDNMLKRWDKVNFVELFGDEIFEPSLNPLRMNPAVDSTTSRLRDYVKYMDDGSTKGYGSTLDGFPKPPAYIYENLSPTSPIFDDIIHPAIFDPTETEIVPGLVQFYLGPGGSGAPMHFHRAAYNVLIHGRKLWKLQPPTHSFYSNEHPQHLFNTDVRPKEPMLECTQEPGDIMFVPEMWGHATMNVVDSIGFSLEFVWGASEFSLQEDLMESEQMRITRGYDKEETGDGENRASTRSGTE